MVFVDFLGGSQSRGSHLIFLITRRILILIKMELRERCNGGVRETREWVVVYTFFAFWQKNSFAKNGIIRKFYLQSLCTLCCWNIRCLLIKKIRSLRMKLRDYDA